MLTNDEWTAKIKEKNEILGRRNQELKIYRQRVAGLESMVARAEEHNENLKNQVADLRGNAVGFRGTIDNAYDERARLLALLATVFPAAIKTVPPTSPGDLYTRILHLSIGGHQATWHLHDSQVPYFRNLPTTAEEWDGHTTAEKYQNIQEYALRGIRRQYVPETQPQCSPGCLCKNYSGIL